MRPRSRFLPYATTVSPIYNPILHGSLQPRSPDVVDILNLGSVSRHHDAHEFASEQAQKGGVQAGEGYDE
jgi:hypothetical protein